MMAKEKERKWTRKKIVSTKERKRGSDRQGKEKVLAKGRKSGNDG
jgi:hypothetical protein